MLLPLLPLIADAACVDLVHLAYPFNRLTALLEVQVRITNLTTCTIPILPASFVFRLASSKWNHTRSILQVEEKNGPRMVKQALDHPNLSHIQPHL